MSISINIQEVRQAVLISRSLREAAKKLGLNHPKLSRIIKKYGIDNSHFIFHKNYYERLVGKQFGDLTILKTYFNSNKRRIALCHCKCGNEKEIRLDSITSGIIVSCGCLSSHKKSLKMFGNNNPSFKGIGEIGSNFFKYYQRSAKRRNIEFNVDMEYLWKLFLDQNKKCTLTGMNLFFGRFRNSKETNASLDRIDSSKGYVKGNLQWVLKDVNLMKGVFSQQHYIEICNLVTNNQK